MKRYLSIFLVLVFWVNVANGEERWEKAIYIYTKDTNTNIIYSNKNNTDNTIGYIPDFIIFEFKEIDENWYKVKTSNKYGEAIETIGFSKIDKNNMIRLSDNSNYIDGLIKYLTLNSIEFSDFDKQKGKIYPKVLIYFEKLLRKNHNSVKKSIAIQLSIDEKRNLYLLYKWLAKHIIVVWANGIAYTRNANDAIVVSIYFKTLFDIEQTLEIKKNIFKGNLDFKYWIGASLFPLTGYEILSFCSNSKQFNNKGYKAFCSSLDKKNILSLVHKFYTLPIELDIVTNKPIKFNKTKANIFYKKIKDIPSNEIYKYMDEYPNCKNSAYWFYKNKEYKKSIFCFDILMKLAYAERNAIGRVERYKEYIFIAKGYYHLKNHKLHSLYIQKAIDEVKKFNGENSLELLSIYKELEKFYLKNKAYKKAYFYSLKTFNIFENHLKNFFVLLHYEDKNIFLKSNLNIVSSLLSISNLNKNNISISQQTLNNWLNYKGSIFDSENAITTLYENTKDIELKEKIDDLHIKQRAYAKLQQSFSNKKDYKQKLKEKEEEINSLTNDISSRAKSFKEAQGLKNIKYQDISSTLKEDEIYIDYAKAGENYYIFTLDKKENITFTQIDKNNTKEIDKLVEAFRVDIAEILKGLGKLTPNRLKQLNQNSQKTLSHLYTLLIEPLSTSIKGKDKLLISPDGALRLLPFEALYDNHHYLIEDKEILYTPSGKERVRVTRYNQIENNETKNSKVVIFADPDYLYIPNEKLIAWEKEDANQTKQGEIVYTEAFKALSTLPESFNRLETTNKEAKAVADAFDIVDIDEYKRKRANERNLFQTKHPKILHLSTHGFFLNAPNVTNPMLKSGIILTGATKARRFNRDEGIVTALKLSGLQLKNTDLVVLSACQTAEVDSNSTQSVSGLSKAFIQAGAKNVLSTLWSVAELETTTLISDFYNQIAKNRGYSTALREAKLDMITQGKHPFFWGGFVLFGE